MGMFTDKPKPQLVTTGRFEIERDGEIAYLEYTLAGNILALLHSEVPETLQHQGLGSSLAETALRYAKDRNLKVDVVCSTVQHYLTKHPEYSDLLLR